MYKETTGVQVARAVAVWVFGFGVAASFFVSGDILAGRFSTATTVALLILAVGAGTIVWAKWKLTKLDEFNRPFLLSEQGASVLSPRHALASKVTTVKRIFLGGTIVAGSLFIVLVSAYNCEEGQGGFCGVVTTPSDTVLMTLQTATVVMGLLYIACVVLTRTHESETERIDLIIARGQEDRRNGGPLSGRRSVWE